MKYRVEYSRASVRDLERVRAEVFEVSRDYHTTVHYLDDLLDKVEEKADFPKSGSPLYYQDRFTGYYFVVFKEYLVFYRVEKNAMLVDRILFSRSDYIRCLHLYPGDHS